MEILYNSKFKKIIAVFLIVAVLFTGIGPSYIIPTAYATPSDADDNSGGMLGWVIAKLLSWLTGIFQELMDLCFGITAPDHLFITSIVYGQVDAFDINIFRAGTLSNPTGGRADAALNEGVVDIIAKYYGFCRTLAIAASLVILIYVGIRIVISTSAGDLTKYKSLLKDWLLSLALVLMMHYIMSLVLYTCDALTNMFATMGGIPIGASASASASATGADFYTYIDSQIDSNAKNALLYSIIKLSFLGTTIAFIFIYAKRTVMMAFLTIVAPLVGMSYTIDKIKDGQSQILDKWMKEYIYTALVMPLDALLFSIVSGMMLNLMSATQPNIILVLALLFGYLPLRGWFTEFIGADKASHGMAGVAAGAMMQKTLSDVGKLGKKGSNNNERTKLPGNTNGEDPTGASGTNPGTLGGASPSNVLASGGASGSTNGEALGNALGGGNSKVSSPSSYVDLSRKIKSGTFDKKDAKELAGKVGKGALKTGTKLGKAGLAGAGAILALGGTGSLTGGIIGAQAGGALANKIEEKVPQYATKAKNAALVGGNVIGAMHNARVGGKDARQALMNEGKHNINMQYNSEMNDLDSELRNNDIANAERVRQLQDYSGMSTSEFMNLSDDERTNVMSAVRDTIGAEEYDQMMNDSEIEEYKDDLQLGLFAQAQQENFTGARIKEQQRYKAQTTNIEQRRQEAAKNRNDKLDNNRNRYQNASRRAIGAEYRASGSAVHNEKTIIKNERRAESRAQKKKKTETSNVETIEQEPVVTARQIHTNNSPTLEYSESYDSAPISSGSYNSEPINSDTHIDYEPGYMESSEISDDYSGSRDYTGVSYNSLSGSDRSEAVQAAIDVVGKDAYNAERSRNGAASADRWAYETAQKANFRSSDVVIESPKPASKPQHKSNEKVIRTNETNKEHSNEKRANRRETSNQQKNNKGDSTKK